MKLSFLILLSINCHTTVLGSHNDKSKLVTSNSIAFAYPSDIILIDGDITDWPEGIIQYPFNNYQGGKTDSTNDLKAYFQVAYNNDMQCLYFAVVIEDDNHIIDTLKDAQPYTQDTYSLYLNPKNKQSGSGVVSFHFNNVWQKIEIPGINWDPEISNINWNNIEYACKRNDSVTIYEYSIKLEGEVYPGRSIAIDHFINDTDMDNNNSFLAWGTQTDKAYIPGRLGYIILMKENDPIGSVSGRLMWDIDTLHVFPKRLNITSIHNPALWVQVSADSTGRFSTNLPKGSYKISTVKSYPQEADEYIRINREKYISTFSIKANKVTDVPGPILKTQSLPDLIPEIGIMHNFDDSNRALLDSFIRAYMQYYEIPGISIALIKDSKLSYHKTYGLKNTYTNESVNNNTLFEAGSITKPVFAFAVNRLVEKGIIELDKPLYEYLPFEDINHDKRHKLITTRHVLCHQTGFPNWARRNEEGKFDLKFTPGTDFGYSGEGFEYLKRVVAHITKKDIGTILYEEVIKPLNLKNIYFKENDYLSGVAAHGHFDNLPTNIRLIKNPQMAYSMSTEAKSFADFVLALQNQKGLQADTYNEMFKIQSTIPLDDSEKKDGWDENYYYGLGFKIENSPYGLVYGHSGLTSKGFVSNFSMFKDLDMGYVVFTNSYGGIMLVLSPLTEFLITGKKK